jgi:Dolichyl-phosphate-mannose-protein mannosyltransferase
MTPPPTKADDPREARPRDADALQEHSSTAREPSSDARQPSDASREPSSNPRKLAPTPRGLASALRGLRTPLVFLLAFAALLALHWSLLGLPYYWDEAGYFIPAARDIYTDGSFIPHSTLSNAHPPLVMAYLALAWKLFGFRPEVTRTAMLLVSALALTALFRLAERVSNARVAAATVITTALYPVFFAQSSLAHLDMTAAALTLWGLFLYLPPHAPRTAQGEQKSLRDGAKPQSSDAATLPQDVTALRQDATPLARDAATLQDDAATLRQTAQPLHDAANESRRDTQALQDDAKALQRDAETLQADAETLQGGAKPLQSDAKLLQSGAKLLQNDVKPLQDDARALQSDTKTLQSDAKALQGGAKDWQSGAKTSADDAEALRGGAGPSRAVAKLPRALDRPSVRRALCVAVFALAGLAKETALLVPVVLCGWEVLCRLINASLFDKKEKDKKLAALVCVGQQRSVFWSAALLLACVPLALWLAYHRARTGYAFGNPEYFRYNVANALGPSHLLYAAWERFKHVTFHMGLWVLTLAGLGAMLLKPRRERGVERTRISVPVQILFAALVLAQTVALSFVGGAVLARYLLPVLPLVILVWVSTLWRRVPAWPLAVALVCAAFAYRTEVNPPYTYPWEDNLAYRDFTLLHRDAARFLAEHAPDARVLTSWPAADELRYPYLGYTPRPLAVFAVADFKRETLEQAARQREDYDAALLYSTHGGLSLEDASRLLGARVLFQEERKGQWVAVLDPTSIQTSSQNHPR